MQRSLSYLLPLAALLLVAVLGYRWLNNRPSDAGDITQNAEGIEIADLTGDEPTLSGVDDRTTVQLESTDDMARGDLRYSLVGEDQVQFSVQATLPELEENEHYQLWFEGEKGPKKAMKLIPNKGGYLGQGTLSSEFDAIRVMVSKESTDDNTIESVILEGNLELVEAEEVNS